MNHALSSLLWVERQHLENVTKSYFADMLLLLQGISSPPKRLGGKIWRPKLDGVSSLEVNYGMLSPEARVGRVMQLKALERPFAAGEAVKSWLDDASNPLDSLDTPSGISSLSDTPQDFIPSQDASEANKGFDEKAEEQTRQFLAGISSRTAEDRPQKPFVPGRNSPLWLEAAFSLVVSLTFLLLLRPGPPSLPHSLFKHKSLRFCPVQIPV